MGLSDPAACSCTHETYRRTQCIEARIILVMSQFRRQCTGTMVPTRLCIGETRISGFPPVTGDRRGNLVQVAIVCGLSSQTTPVLGILDHLGTLIVVARLERFQRVNADQRTFASITWNASGMTILPEGRVYTRC